MRGYIPVIRRVRAIAERLETLRMRRLLLFEFAVVASLLTLLPCLRFLHSGNATDYRVWFDAGQAVLHQRELYPSGEPFPFMYPPTCALLVTLPAACGKAAFLLILALVNSVAWILCISFSMRLATDGPQRFFLAIAFLTSCILVVYIWSSYHLGQPSLILLALMLAAFLCMRRNRETLAGAFIALAAAIKAFPVLALFYLIYRRYWRATISLLLVLGFLLLVVPIPFRGPSQTLTDFQNWRRGMIHYQAKGIAQRQLRGYTWKNQSIFGLANRMLRRVNADETAVPLYANLAELEFKTVNIIIIVVALLIGLSFVALMPRVRTAETDALEFSALLILILLFTPLAFGYLFIWLMLPFSVLISRILTRADAIAGAGVSAALVLLAITALAPRLAQVYGSVFFASLTLYFTLAVELWRAKFIVPELAQR
jgi:glycosyl transferase family 87